MIEIKDLLARVKDVLFSEEGKKEVVIEAVKKYSKVILIRENIDIKNGIVFLNTKPIYKTEISLRKNEILTELRLMLGKKAPKDIR